MFDGWSGSRWMPRKIAGSAMSTIDASSDAMNTPSVVFDNATHRYRSLGAGTSPFSSGPAFTCVLPNYLYHTAIYRCIIQPMSAEATRDLRSSRLAATEGDALDLVETEMAVLTRALEGHQRRSEIYQDLDRASYLIARTLEATAPVSINGLASTLA